MDEIRKEVETKKQKYNDLVIRAAALRERINSQQDNLESRKRNLYAQEEKEAKEIIGLRKSKILFDCYTNLSQSFARLASLAKSDLDNLDNDFGTVNKAALEVQKLSDQAIEASNMARKAFDEENQKLSEVQVELGRLEVQVQNAVDVIDGIEGVSVDKALMMPDIDNREKKLDKQFKIRRRIANMGIIL